MLRSFSRAPVLVMLAFMSSLVAPSGAPAGAADLAVPTDCTGIDNFGILAQRGTFVDYPDGKLDQRAVTQLTAMREELGLSNQPPGAPHRAPKTLVVHLHGGLVERCQGFSEVVNLGPLYRATGAFPIFPIYHIGLKESLDNGHRNIGEYRIPDPQAASVIDRMYHINTEARLRADTRRDHVDDHTTKMEERYRYGAFVNIGLWKGGRAWSYMKGVIDKTMRLDSAENDKEGTAGGIALGNLLHDYVGRHPDTSIVFVGHSTGAIWITKFLRAWHRDHHGERTRFSVIFMAPAIRYDDFAQLLKPDANGAPIDLVRNLRIFTMRDEYESHVNELGALFANKFYGPSLLYAISAIFEDHPDTPLLGMQRFQCNDGTHVSAATSKPIPAFADYGTFHDLALVQQVNAFLNARFPAAFAYSPALGSAIPPTYQTGSVTHGGFPRDFATLQSIMTLVDSASQKWPVPAAAVLDPVEGCGVDAMTLFAR